MATEVYEHVLSATLAGQFCQTVFHTKVNNSSMVSAFGMADDLNKSLVAASSFNEFLTAATPAHYSQTSIRTRRVLPLNAPTAILLAGAFDRSVGQRTGNISSAQANPLIIWIPTTDPGKTGRTFIPGVSETDIEEMQLAPGLLSALQDLIDWVKAPHATDGFAADYSVCVARRSPTPPKSVTSGDDVFDGYVSPLIGTQRRRLHPV